MQIQTRLAFIMAAVGLIIGAPGAPTMPAHSQTAAISALPEHDMRAHTPPVDVNTPRAFPPISSLAEWETRRAAIRQQVLVSCGLYPLPAKTPLKAKIFDRVVRDGYSIEKVYFQTYPGFYLAGNLYRPIYRPTDNTAGAKKVHPGILVAHGHGELGRMTDTDVFSIPARAITFAREGCVAFTYDMVGYNDTRQITQHRQYANDPRSWLWGVSMMGLQTWNSIRALDFLSSLEDVDKSRLAITGESGGGTQTMLLGAVDDRLAAVGPCVMVSHSMQGGCLCENAPGLRVDYSNMEIAAMAAPRPQIMVGATGDWTKDMMTVEGPAVESVYKLYGKPDHVHYCIYNYGHNINKTSREAVDRFFGRWLLGLDAAAANSLTEPAYKMEPVESLRVFPDNTPLPGDAKTPEQLTQSLIAMAQAQVDQRKPRDARSLSQFKKTYLPAWQHTLLLDTPLPKIVSDERPVVHNDNADAIRLTIGRPGKGDRIPCLLFAPQNSSRQGLSSGNKNDASSAIVLAHPKGIAAFLTNDGKPTSLVAGLLSKGRMVLLLDTFLTGSQANAAISKARDVPFGDFFSTYNRTDLQERVQDLVTACAYLRQNRKVRHVAIAGIDEAGIWALLAAPVADAVAADCARLDTTTDEALLKNSLYVPGLRRMGDFRTAAVLAAPRPLLLHNTGDNFTASEWIGEVFQSLGAGNAFQANRAAETETGLLNWLTAQ